MAQLVFCASCAQSFSSLPIESPGVNASAALPQRERPASRFNLAAGSGPEVAGSNPGPPMPSGSERAVTLAEILAYADKHSPLLAIARTGGARAQAVRKYASIGLQSNPELTVAGGPRMGEGDRGIDLQLGLRQQLEISGQRGARVAAADRLLELSSAEIEDARWRVHCDVHEAFHRMLVQRERAALAAQIVVFQEDVLRLVERQVKAGETARLSLRLGEAEVAQAKQLQVAAEHSLLASRIQLAQLAGWPSDSPPAPAGATEAPKDPPPLVVLQKAAQLNHPALRVAGARVEEARARIDVADRDGSVKPSIGIDYGREAALRSQGANHVLLGVVSVPIPLFQRNQSARAAARADADVANAEVNAIIQLLQAQVGLARSEVLAAATRSRAYSAEILPKFEENLLLLRRSFELGEIDLLSLSVGRERFLQIQHDALSAQLEYFSALASLERAVGAEF